MSNVEPRPKPGSRPTAWVLAAPGAGDNGQLRTLVDLLNADARWIDQVDPVSRVLRDRLTGFRARAVPADKRAVYAPPWPDLVLIAGGRAVIDARRIQHASGGKSRVVCLGRPWAPMGWFDLIITTPQYCLPAADNLITLDLPLNQAPPSAEDDFAYWQREFASLPAPMLGVLLGGDSGSYSFDLASADRIVNMVNELAGRAGGSAVLIGSPRTPSAAIGRIRQGIDVPARVQAWQPQAPNPYAALLKLADALLVTGDSASMLAEACDTEKPVALCDLRERPRSRLNRTFRDAMPALTRATQALTARGLWVPARDMSELHRRAAASGLLTDSTRLLTTGARISAPVVRPLNEVRDRVRALLGS